MFEDLISVIVPVYNVKDFLPRCIDSILVQTYSNIEIILSDDGSNDGSSDLCDAYAKKDKRVIVIHEKNMGLSEARNRGIKISKGKFISFVDSDDWISPNFLLKMYYALIKNSSDVSECLFKRTQSSNCCGVDTGKIECFTNNEMLLKLCKNNHERHVVAWNKLYKKWLFNNLTFPVGKLHEDEFTMHKVFQKCNKVSIIYDELYFYYQNPSSIINKKISSQRLDSIDGLFERLLFFKKLNLLEHYNYCSALLFKQFTDFISIPRNKFENKKVFIQMLKTKFNFVKKYFSTQEFSLEQKTILFLSKINFKFTVFYDPLFKIISFIKRIFGFFRKRAKRFLNIKQRREKKNFLSSYKSFCNSFTNKKKALILGVVEYANYGDLAIGEYQYQLLKSKFDVFEVSQKNTLRYIEAIKKHFKSINVIFMPGGGNISEIWKYDEDIRRLVIKTFPHTPIVIFPQSYGYTSDNSDYQIEGSKIYNNHGNVTIFARDNYSLKKFSKIFSNCLIKLAPDTVLLGKQYFQKTKTIDVGLCFRDDKETNPVTIEILIKIILLLKANNIPFKFLSTVENTNICLNDRGSAVASKINEISNCKYVITDRLHCGIFSILSNTNCSFLNNSNSKIKNFVSTWEFTKQLKILNNSDIITSAFIKKALNSSKYYELNLTKEFAQLEETINQYAEI